MSTDTRPAEGFQVIPQIVDPLAVYVGQIASRFAAPEDRIDAVDDLWRLVKEARRTAPLLAQNAPIPDPAHPAPEVVEALRAIADMQPEPVPELPEHEDCPECRRWEGHPLHRGICDERYRQLRLRDKRQRDAWNAQGGRMRDIARAALAALPAQREPATPELNVDRLARAIRRAVRNPAARESLGRAADIAAEYARLVQAGNAVEAEPSTEREHLTDGTLDCWCRPYRDTEVPEVIIHREEGQA